MTTSLEAGLVSEQRRCLLQGIRLIGKTAKAIITDPQKISLVYDIEKGRRYFIILRGFLVLSGLNPDKIKLRYGGNGISNSKGLDYTHISHIDVELD